MRILLADDHAIFRSGLRRILEEELPGAVLGEVASIAELAEALGNQPWDILILDISMGGQNSLNALPSLKQSRPHVGVIVLSMYGDRPFVVRALRAGASAYITKEHAPEELLRALRAVSAGRRYIGESLAEQLADHMATTGKGGPAHENLSPRELEIFLLLASAKSVSEIAAQLGLSVKTISTHRSRILEKMGLGSNAELMQYAMRNGLVG